jgi:hypothetical protein
LFFYLENITKNHFYPLLYTIEIKGVKSKLN